jgi:hypothetical protein
VAGDATISDLRTRPSLRLTSKDFDSRSLFFVVLAGDLRFADIFSLCAAKALQDASANVDSFRRRPASSFGSIRPAIKLAQPGGLPVRVARPATLAMISEASSNRSPSGNASRSCKSLRADPVISHTVARVGRSPSRWSASREVRAHRPIGRRVARLSR